MLAPSPKKTTATLSPSLQLSGKGGADRYGETCADYPVGAQHPDAKIGYVHGAAFALAVPGYSPVDLRHHPLEVGALCDAVAVTPVIAHDTVVQPQVGADADRHRFLAYVGMDEARDASPRVFQPQSFPRIGG